MEESRLDRIEKNLELFTIEFNRMHKQIAKEILDLKESQKKTDEQLQKTDEQLQKTIKKLDNIGKQLGDLGLVQGEVAEDLFYRNVKSLFKEEKITFKSVERNLKKKGVAEYDIVAIDGDKVLVIEVKNKLNKNMVDNFINKKIPIFKDIFPKYSNYRILGGMGALVIRDEIGRYAEKAGLYVLTQTSDGGAALLNKKNFKAKIFG
ncbi:MAG: hypothetical protein HQK79_10395 [Desulfobacterales bacterium]|nr:hypothetical protein [Desulfobacterales bacterium]